MNFTCQIPGKIILFGEWSVLYNHKAVSIPINQYLHLKTCESDNPKIKIDDKTSIQTSELISNDEPDFFFSKKSIQNLDLEFLLKKHSFILKKNWKTDYGLGSSSACFAAFVLLKVYTQKKSLSKTQLFNEFWPILKKIQAGGSGIDFATQMYQHPLIYSQNQKDTKKLSDFKLPNNIFFIHTGQKTSTRKALKSTQPLNQHILALAQSTAQFIDNRNWAQAINQHFEIQRKMDIISNELEQNIIALKETNGVQAVKTTGAGGGDCLMVLTQSPKHKDNVLRFCQEMKWTLKSYNIHN